MSGAAGGAKWGVRPKTDEAWARLKVAQQRNHELLRLQGALAAIANIRNQSPDLKLNWDNDPNGPHLKMMHVELGLAAFALQNAIHYARMRRQPKRTRTTKGNPQ